MVKIYEKTSEYGFMINRGGESAVMMGNEQLHSVSKVKFTFGC